MEDNPGLKTGRAVPASRSRRTSALAGCVIYGAFMAFLLFRIVND
ncbi:hypothetical protein [Methanospirillum sp.]|nr:hypothetical protein [Methanospirillum sp.]